MSTWRRRRRRGFFALHLVEEEEKRGRNPQHAATACDPRRHRPFPHLGPSLIYCARISWKGGGEGRRHLGAVTAQYCTLASSIVYCNVVLLCHIRLAASSFIPSSPFTLHRAKVRVAIYLAALKSRRRLKREDGCIISFPSGWIRGEAAAAVPLNLPSATLHARISLLGKSSDGREESTGGFHRRRSRWFIE